MKMKELIRRMEEKGYTYKYNDTQGNHEFHDKNEVIAVYDDEQAESKIEEILSYI